MTIMKLKQVAVGGVAAIGVLAGSVDVASADIIVSDLIQPYKSNNRAVVGGRIDGAPAGFLALQMKMKGTRSSWSGYRDEYAWNYGAADIGNYRKRGQCATKGTYDRKSTFTLNATVQGGSSITAGGYGASYSGPIQVSTSYNGSKARFDCQGGGVVVVS